MSQANPSGELYMADSVNDTVFEARFMATSAIKQRYTLLSYMYSQLYLSSTKGKSYIRPVFFDEPQSSALMAEPVEDSYMAGEALKVSNVLEAGKDTFTSKFPMGTWLALDAFLNETMTVGQGKNIQTLSAKNLGYATVHMKAGTAIPYQPEPIKTSRDLLEMQKTQFVAFRDESGFATGHFLVDDGVQVHTEDNHAFWRLRLAQNTVTFWLEGGSRSYDSGLKNQYLESVRIVQAKDLAKTDFACAITHDLVATTVAVNYNSGSEVLELRPVDEVNVAIKDINMIRFGDSSKDINMCEMSSTFKYKVNKTEMVNGNRTMMVTLQNKAIESNMVYANFSVLDDNMDDVKVSFSNKMTFTAAAQMLVNENNFNHTSKTPAQIKDLVEINADPFYYTIKNSAGQ